MTRAITLVSGEWCPVEDLSQQPVTDEPCGVWSVDAEVTSTRGRPVVVDDPDGEPSPAEGAAGMPCEKW